MDISNVKKLFVNAKTNGKSTVSTPQSKPQTPAVFDSAAINNTNDGLNVEKTTPQEQTKTTTNATNPFKTNKEEELTQANLNKRIDDIHKLSENERNKTHEQLKFEEIEKIAQLPQTQYERITSRNLIYDKDRAKQFSGEEIIQLSTLSDEQFKKLKDSGLYNIKERKENQLSGQTLSNLANSPDNIIERAKKLSYIKERGQTQFSDKAVDYLAKLPDEDWQNMEKRNLFYIKERGEKQIGGAIGEFAKLSDEEFAKVKERGLLYDKQVAGTSGAHLAKLSDAEYETIKDFIHYSTDSKIRLNEEDLINVAKLTTQNPEKLQKLKDSNLLGMIKQGKISSGVLHNIGANSDLSDNLMQDLKDLKEGKSTVKEFKADTSLENAFKNSKTGDAVEIGDKMYINNGKTLQEWKMTKEKYQELFPAVERFTTMQGAVGDCYLVTALDGCMKNPKTRADLYSMFSQEGNDVYVQLKGGAKSKIKFENSEVFLGKENQFLTGCKGFQMLEQAYAINQLAEPEQNCQAITNDITHKALMKNIEGGYSSDAVSRLLGYTDVSNYTGATPNYNKSTKFVSIDIPNETQTTSTEQNNSKHLKSYLTKFANNDKYMLQFGTYALADEKAESTLNKDYNLLSQHAYSVVSYDKQSGMVTINNPHNSSVDTKVPISVLSKYVDQLYLTNIE